MRKLGHVEEARGARAILAVRRAVVLFEPSLLDKRHQHIGTAHQDGESDDKPGVRADCKAHKPRYRRSVLRVAAETIEAVAHQAIGTTIGVAEAEIEIAEHSDAEANKEQRQADQITARIDQACAIPIQYRDKKGGNHPAAKQTPKHQALPASGFGRGPNTEGRRE